MGRRPGVPDLDDILTRALLADDDAGADAMIDATSELIAAYGLRRWSMDDVAARCGLARATVYRRFESRDQLVRAALVRDARRFFSAVAGAVQRVEPFEAKVVEGFVVGLDLVRVSPLPRLLGTDPAAALALVGSESFLRAGRRALVESYESLVGRDLDPADGPRVEAVAEALIRLGLSLLLAPGLLGGTTDQEAGDRDRMRRSLSAVIGPLVSSPLGAAPTGPGGQPSKRSSTRISSTPRTTVRARVGPADSTAASSGSSESTG